MRRAWVITASLTALFMGALDSLVLSAALPTIVSDLGGMEFYSWVFTTNLLTRTVSLPVFGKLADILNRRNLFLSALGLFIVASVLAAIAPGMPFLVVARALQGLGSGAIFAMAYITLSDVSPPEGRGKSLSLASFIWGFASLLGPTLGGFAVTFLTWRWIFLINIAPGLFSAAVIMHFLNDNKPKKHDKPSLDIVGIISLPLTVLALLILIMVAGIDYDWLSIEVLSLAGLVLFGGIIFLRAEKNAVDPLISLEFFKHRGFCTANGSAFFGSLAIFVLFAFAPLMLQGVMGQNAMQVGLVMMAFSMGSSVGTLILGQVIIKMGSKTAAILGGIAMVAGTAGLFWCSSTTSMVTCIVVFSLLGVGIGFVVLATMLIVQVDLGEENLGISTTSNQFARTFGGTIGITICGRMITSNLTETVHRISSQYPEQNIPADLLVQLNHNLENMFQPEVLARIPETARILITDMIAAGIFEAFELVFYSVVFCLLLSFLLPRVKFNKEQRCLFKGC